MGLLTDDVTVVKPLLDTLKPLMEEMLGPVGILVHEGHYCAVDFHGQVFKIWVNPVTHQLELEQV